MKPFDLEWMKKYRSSEYARMIGLAKAEQETPAQKRKRTILANLLKKVEKLGTEVRVSCPHLLENQRYEEHGRSDTLGNYRSGMDMTVRCVGCGNVLDRWYTP